MVTGAVALKPLPVTCTFVPGCPDCGVTVMACVMLKFTVTVLPMASFNWSECEPPGSFGMVKPVRLKPPRESVVAALALITFPSIRVEITDDGAKPVPLTATVLPPVKEAGVTVAAELTTKPVEAVFPEPSNIASE